MGLNNFSISFTSLVLSLFWGLGFRVFLCMPNGILHNPGGSNLKTLYPCAHSFETQLPL